MTAERLERVDYPTAESTRQRADECNIAHADRTYRPCTVGVHVCGADHEENRFFTVLNIPARSAAEARLAWEAARAEGEVPDGAYELCVDLNYDDGRQHEDFWTTRQMLPRIHAAALRALASSKGPRS